MRAVLAGIPRYLHPPHGHPMNRLLSSFLLCLAMIALPVQGAAAAVMMVCGVAEAAGLSMPERHAAIKAEAESELAVMPPGHCHDETGAAMPDAADMPTWQGDHAVDAANDHDGHNGQHGGHHAAGACSACAACAASAMLLPEIPLVALMHHRHSTPLASATAFASQLPLPADRPPARRC